MDRQGLRGLHRYDVMIVTSSIPGQLQQVLGKRYTSENSNCKPEGAASSVYRLCSSLLVLVILTVTLLGVPGGCGGA
jgi:hypothetical protein